MSSCGVRLDEAMGDAGIASRRKLAALAQVRPATITDLARFPETNPHRNTFDTVCRVLGNLNPEWLMHGTGPRYLGLPPYRGRIREVLIEFGFEANSEGFDAAAKLAKGTMGRALVGEKVLTSPEAERAARYSGRPMSWFLSVPQALPEGTDLELALLALARASREEGSAPDPDSTRFVQAVGRVSRYIQTSRTAGHAPDPETLTDILRASLR